MKQPGIRALGEDWDDFKVVSQKIKILHHIAVARDAFGVELTPEVVVRDWGRGLRYETASYYGHPSPAEVTDAESEAFVQAFTARSAEFPKHLQADALASHQRITASGLPRFMVTSHLTQNALQEMNLLGIHADDYLFVHGSDRVPAIKPDPAAFDPAKEILAHMNIAPEEVIYGGDTLGDGLAARGAGMQFLGVTTGRTSYDEFRDNGFQAVSTLTQFTDHVLQNLA